MFTYHQQGPVTVIISVAISQEITQPSVSKINLKMSYLEFRSNLPEVNELKSEGDINPEMTIHAI